MRSYSVKEIADMLQTNPETVRRWIRSGKLKAVDNSKKKGANKVILESALDSFLKTSPQYVGTILGTLTAGPGLIAGGLIGTANVLLAAKKVEEQQIARARVSEDSLYAFVAAQIAEERSKLKSLLAEREKLDQKIQIVTEVLAQHIERLDGLDGATVNQQRKLKEDTTDE